MPAKKRAQVRASRPTLRRSSTVAASAAGIEKRRFWLMYPPKFIKTPVLWELGHRFKVITNVRQASVTDEIGIVCLELDGPRAEINAAVVWLEKAGINVEPVEINVIES
jgi:hypothetical protein